MDPQFFVYLRTTNGTSCTLVLFVNTSFSHRGASGLTFCCFRSCHSTSTWLIQQANDTDGVIWLCSSRTRWKEKKKNTLHLFNQAILTLFWQLCFLSDACSCEKGERVWEAPSKRGKKWCERATSTFLIEHSYLGSHEPLRCEVLLSPHQGAVGS